MSLSHEQREQVENLTETKKMQLSNSSDILQFAVKETLSQPLKPPTACNMFLLL